MGELKQPKAPKTPDKLLPKMKFGETGAKHSKKVHIETIKPLFKGK